MKWNWILDKQPEDYATVIMCWANDKEDQWTIAFMPRKVKSDWEKTFREAFIPFWWIYPKDFYWPENLSQEKARNKMFGKLK